MPQGGFVDDNPSDRPKAFYSTEGPWAAGNESGCLQSLRRVRRFRGFVDVENETNLKSRSELGMTTKDVPHGVSTKPMTCASFLGFRRWRRRNEFAHAFHWGG